jgi:acetyltransferase-like isoleucine patch superfamily enzyme
MRWLRLTFWSLANKMALGRFRCIGRNVQFNGWVRFEKYRSDVTVGDDSRFGKGCYLLATRSGFVRIGRNVGMNDFCYITSNYGVTIEDDVRIAEFVSIRDYDHEFKWADRPIHQQGFRGAPIRIGEGSWIGRGVMVTSGVTIGKGCVVGANAVVTKDLPDWSVAVGVPAKVIRSRMPDGQAGSPE